MEPGLVKIVTSTLYNFENEVDRVRANITEKTIERACAKGYEIIIVDGGSEEQTVERFRQAGALVYVQKRLGMGNARRQAIRLALSKKPEVLLWIEPEKLDLIRSIEQITEPFSREDVDLVMPQRKNLSSYPRFQQISEKLGNDFFRQITGIELDIYFGPKAWRANVSDYFLNYKSSNGDNQDSIIIPVLEMMFNGVKTKFVEIDFHCDPEQKCVEERNEGTMNFKRIEQLYKLSSLFCKYERER
jgi:glycosyltransferase involved in cell wall biosynthesis